VSPSRSVTFRRRRLAFFSGAAVVLAAAAYLPVTLLTPLDEAAATPVDYSAPATEAADLVWPPSAAIAVGAVGFPGVLASAGTDAALPIASITKVITALTVLEQHPLKLGEAGPDLTFTSIDVAYERAYYAVGGSTEPVRSGLVLSQYQVLQTVLISSANNYARSLGVWAFGSDAAFVTAAGEWLERHGLHNTTVAEATGIDPANTSTSSDLIELAKLALADPVIAEIVATPAATLPYVGEITSSNKILGNLGVDGIKTGTLPEAGACLLFSTDVTIGSETVTVVGVALGGTKHEVQFPQVTKLIDTVTSGFQLVTLTTAGAVFGNYTTDWGQTAAAVAAESRSVLVWGATPISATVTMDAIGVAAASTPVGTIDFTVGSEEFSVALRVDRELKDPGIWWRLANPAELFD
jgi:D-alanyl-D-alanine carboxypeptidase (penicillin-binding protein 5/6)